MTIEKLELPDWTLGLEKLSKIPGTPESVALSICETIKLMLVILPIFGMVIILGDFNGKSYELVGALMGEHFGKYSLMTSAISVAVYNGIYLVVPFQRTKIIALVDSARCLSQSITIGFGIILLITYIFIFSFSLVGDVKTEPVIWVVPFLLSLLTPCVNWVCILVKYQCPRAVSMIVGVIILPIVMLIINFAYEIGFHGRLLINGQYISVQSVQSVLKWYQSFNFFGS
ncbi:hypothetical protein [Aliivibrio sp. EL58]|uniref:hypothetical protein n=1 Tax=Aliivibrio sp. EL58 TaxID=2107582 RepID=UPI000EFD55F0|nr:hypothetical protein [Aliivibrio sp. EL58]